MQAPRQRIQLSNAKWEKAVEISPFLKKKKKKLRKDLKCTMYNSYGLASVCISRVSINTDYSNNNHTILQDGRLCPGTLKPTLRQE